MRVSRLACYRTYSVMIYNRHQTAIQAIAFLPAESLDSVHREQPVFGPFSRTPKSGIRPVNPPSAAP